MKHFNVEFVFKSCYIFNNLKKYSQRYTYHWQVDRLKAVEIN